MLFSQKSTIVALLLSLEMVLSLPLKYSFNSGPVPECVQATIPTPSTPNFGESSATSPMLLSSKSTLPRPLSPHEALHPVIIPSVMLSNSNLPGTAARAHIIYSATERSPLNFPPHDGIHSSMFESRPGQESAPLPFLSVGNFENGGFIGDADEGEGGGSRGIDGNEGNVGDGGVRASALT